MRGGGRARTGSAAGYHIATRYNGLERAISGVRRASSVVRAAGLCAGSALGLVRGVAVAPRIPRVVAVRGRAAGRRRRGAFKVLC